MHLCDPDTSDRDIAKRLLQCCQQQHDRRQICLRPGALSKPIRLFGNWYMSGHFLTAVTFKPQGTTIYQQFQRGLDVKSLYESVSKEVGELQDYYERKAERRRETLLFFLTFVGLPAGLLSQIFGGILFEGGPQVHPNPKAWAMLGAVSLVIYALSGLIYFVWKRYGR